METAGFEIVDELNTPGCPNCAIKHLSACLYHLLRRGKGSVPSANTPEVEIARAYINVVETLEGYKSHWYYAIGLLNSAEEHFVAMGSPREARETRDLRVVLMKEGPASNVMPAFFFFTRALPFLADAHWDEAFRELPVLATDFKPSLPRDRDTAVSRVLSMIEWVYGNYFEEVTTEEKGGVNNGSKESR